VIDSSKKRRKVRCGGSQKEMSDDKVIWKVPFADPFLGRNSAKWRRN